jgi:hypothetical protein
VGANGSGRRFGWDSPEPPPANYAGNSALDATAGDEVDLGPRSRRAVPTAVEVETSLNELALE